MIKRKRNEYFYVRIFVLLFFLLQIIPCWAQSKRMFLWIDASANWVLLSESAQLKATVEKAAKAGFSDLIIDIKPNIGYVLYPSKIAPRLLEWKGVKRDPDYDYLKKAIEYGRENGLKVHAALNIFSEGSRPSGLGLVYDKHPEWQTYLYTPEGIKPITQEESKQSLFVNPHRSDVRKYELSLIAEVVSNYPQLDGIILDRARFDGISSDFSEETRTAFEKFIGHRVAHWPEDIFTWQKPEADSDYQVTPGPLFNKWIFWRAKLIYDFFRAARDTVKALNPKIEFGDYAGSWYPVYYKLGVNWASKNYHPKYWWADSAYHQTGYAELLDFFLSGCYYYEVTIDELRLSQARTDLRQEAAMGKGKEYWYSVEGACDITNKVIMNATKVYGSLFLMQYKDHPEQFKKAMQMVLQKTGGLMLFDLVYLNEYDWWEKVKEISAE